MPDDSHFTSWKVVVTRSIYNFWHVFFRGKAVDLLLRWGCVLLSRWFECCSVCLLAKLSVFLLHQTDNFDAHDNFTLTKSFGKKLLDGNLRLIRPKIIEQKFVSILYKLKVTFGLKSKPTFRNELCHERGIDQKSMVDDRQEGQRNPITNLPLLHWRDVLYLAKFNLQFFKISAEISFCLHFIFN